MSSPGSELPLPDSSATIERVQRERKRVAFEQARRAPFYRDRLDGIDAERLEDPSEWAKIPVLGKEELRRISPRRFQADFSVTEPGEVAEYWRSGGSTGVPLFYPRSHEDMTYVRISVSRVLRATGVSRLDLVHVSFPYGVHPLGQLLTRAVEREGAAALWAGAGNTTPSAQQLELLQTLDATVWCGMSSYALHLANLAEAEGVDLAGRPVHTLITAGEPITDAKREKLERVWGARLRDVFGMSEGGFMAAEGPKPGLQLWTDMFVIEVLDEETGEPVSPGTPGTLVVTPLWTSSATPFLRWSSGDIVTFAPQERTDDPYSVFPVLRHQSRTAGFFKIRGVNVNHGDLEDFLFAMSEVADFRAAAVTAGDLDGLHIEIEVPTGVDGEAAAGRVRAETKSRFELSATVHVLPRGTLATEFEKSVKAQRFADRR